MYVCMYVCMYTYACMHAYIHTYIHTHIHTHTHIHAYIPQAAVGIFVMKNGCMCCTASSSGGSELERILNHLIELKDDDEYDYVLIETSGLADPAVCTHACVYVCMHVCMWVCMGLERILNHSIELKDDDQYDYMIMY